jgi:calcineurin-like phosphoesterase
VIGMRTEQVLKRFVDQLPVHYDVGEGPPLLQAVVIDVDETTGKARGIRRIREVLDKAA